MEIATKKYLRAVTKTTVTTWAESHWESLSYSILLIPNCQVQDRHFVYRFLLRSSYFTPRAWPRRLTRDRCCMPIVKVCGCTCKHGPVCHCGSHVIWSCPNPTVRSLQALPCQQRLSRKGGRPRVHPELRSAVVYQDTSVAGTAHRHPLRHKRKRHDIVLL